MEGGGVRGESNSQVGPVITNSSRNEEEEIYLGCTFLTKFFLDVRFGGRLGGALIAADSIGAAAQLLGQEQVEADEKDDGEADEGQKRGGLIERRATQSTAGRGRV